MINMFNGKPFRGFNFAPFCGSGILNTDEARESLKAMAETTSSNFVILTPPALQQQTNSTKIDFKTPRTCTDYELKSIIEYAQELGLKVGVKPTLNVRNGMWRAFVDFFDTEVPGEPCWREWFEEYTRFQLHFAKIAHEMGADMFIAGCEMVMSERRSAEWRQLIAEVRDVYSSGIVTYNTDKYQEHIIDWWDCVDVIATSGYYPLHSWDKELARLKAVCEKYDKPLMFAEIGCPACVGSSELPNKPFIDAGYAPEEQFEWFEEMFEKTAAEDWICGYGLWSWHWNLASIMNYGSWHAYDVYGKPAEKAVKAAFDRM